MTYETTVIPNKIDVNSTDDTTLNVNASNKLQIKDAGVSYAKMGADVLSWELLETLNPSSVNSITSSSLSARNKYLLVFEGFSSSALDSIFLRFNGLSTSIYRSSYINGTTMTNTSLNSNGCLVLRLQDTQKTTSQVLLSGISKDSTSGSLTVAPLTIGAVTEIKPVCCNCALGNNVQIDTITFRTTSALFSGEIKIYGAD